MEGVGKDALVLPGRVGAASNVHRLAGLSWGARLEDSGPLCAVMGETCGVPQEGREGKCGSPDQRAWAHQQTEEFPEPRPASKAS